MNLELLFIISVALFWVFIIFFTPITLVGRLNGPNAVNNLFRIKMDSRLGRVKFGSIWAQEYYESKTKRKPWNFIQTGKDSFQRKLELMGHEIEVQSAYILSGVDDRENHREREAYALSTRYSEFRGMDVSLIEKQMRDNSKDAIKWVSKNQKKINKIIKNKWKEN